MRALRHSSRFVRSFRPVLIAAGVSVGLAACATQPAAPSASAGAISTLDSNTVTVKLIALNDFHGHLQPPSSPVSLPGLEAGKTVEVALGGAAYIATEIKALQAQNAQNIVIGAGDLISASPLESALFHDEPAVQVLDALGLELSAVGNHEFDRGREALLRMQNGGCAPDGVPGKDTCMAGSYRGAAYRYLAANVIDEASGKPLLPAYGIKQFATPGGTVRIAFIGVVVKSVPDLVSRTGIPGLRFDDEADTVNALLPAIRAQGIQSIVVLIHEGGKSTGSYNDHDCPGFTGRIVDIVSRLDPAVDAVVSAHTHQPYVCQLPSREPARTILVTSGGSYGRYVTDIDLVIDPATDDVLSTQANNIAIVNDLGKNAAPALYPALAADPAIAAIVSDYAQRAAPVADRIVGRIRSPLKNKPDQAGESSLGLVIADAQLESARTNVRGGARIAFMNAGGVRADLLPRKPRGSVDYGQVYTAQPFGAHLAALTLTGRQLHDVLEAQWHADGTSAILLPSRGFRYTWRARAPLGAKVDPGSMKLDGKRIQPNEPYRVVVSNFLADGGDAFKTFTQGTDRQDLDDLDRDILIDYLGRHSPLAVPRGGRIKRID